MPRTRFVPDRVLLLALLLVVLPAYGLYTGQTTVVTYSLIGGGILWVWKWRWWWEPVRDYVARHTDVPDAE